MTRARTPLVTFLAHGLFWSWNFIFFVFVSVGLFPWCLVTLLQETVKGRLPWDFTCCTLLLLLIPFASVGAAGVLIARGGGARLLRLFYGLQAPLLFLCLLRLFFVRELSPGMAHVLFTCTVALTAYGYELFRGADHRSRTVAMVVQLVGHGCVLITGVYSASLLGFYALPLGWTLIRGVCSLDLWWRVLDALVHTYGLALFFLVVGGGLLLYSATLFVGLPAALVVLYCQSWRRVHRACADRFGRVLAWSITVGVVTISIALFVSTNRQPQQRAFALLSEPPASDAARRALIAQAQSIRAGLLNAYLSPYRYLSGTGENTHIAVLYSGTFGMNAAAAQRLQGLYNILARPLLYDGASMRADQGRAEAAYERFFDEPIQKGEQVAILRAINATYDRDQAEAGLLNRGQRKVWLAQQQVAVTESGDWGEVEVHEAYENQTIEEQEVFYYFSLPSSAVVTGLWLGDSEDHSRRHAFTVAARGAAQEVYRHEVQRRRDPSVLEQIGPRQYRLRAFPIPARADKLRRAPRVHLWFTYKVLRRGDGWPLPALLERRNVYWDASSARTVNGQPAADCDAAWMCPVVRAENRTAPLVHEVMLPDGDIVRATPLTRPAAALPAGLQLAVVLDRSASMRQYAGPVEETFTWLQRDVAQANRLDLYLTAAPSRGEAPSLTQDFAAFDARQVVYFGGQKMADLLRQFESLRGDRHYDAILVLTDAGGFDLASEREPPVPIAAPLWMIHLGGHLSPGYDDAMLDAIEKRGGGVAVSAKEAVQGLTTPANASQQTVDGYRWVVEPGAARQPTADGFAPLAARQFIRMRMQSVDLSDRTQLARLHDVALRAAIVSPYSSMIVLVTEGQRQALRAAEQRDDRFERETESGKEVLSHPINPFAFGTATAFATPEPAEWMLLCIAVLGLLYALRRGAPPRGRLAS